MATRLKNASKTARKTRQEELDRVIPEKENALKAAETELAEARLNFENERTRIETERRALEEQRGKLRYPDMQSAKAAADSLDEEIREANKALEEAKKGLDDCKNAINELNGRIAAADNLLKEDLIKNLDEVTEKRDGLVLMGEDAERRKSEVEIRINTNEDVLEKIRDTSETLAAL